MQGSKLRLLCVGTLLVAGFGCAGGFRKGRKAELRKDYDTALVDFEKAVKSQPENSKYLIHEKLARSEASLFHLHRGQALLKDNRTDEAVGEFQKAASIDPSNVAAAQELGKLLAAQAAVKRGREAAIQQALQAREETGNLNPVQLKPFPPEPLAHFRVSADSRKVFETLAKLADLNVAFTADFQSRPISEDLTNVKIEDTLNVLSLQTKSFWKAVTPNTILVIADTPTNRRDYEDEIVKTIYLSNPLAAADRTAISTALKQILGMQRILDNPDANAIVIRDTPSKVAAAEKMIHDLDQGKAEILIEVAVIEADRDRVRDLGIEQVPGSLLPAAGIAGLGFNPRNAITFGTAAVPAFPLNRLGSISTADFSITVPGALANALLNDSRTHLLQNPQVRVTDGQTAKVRIGTRIPIATGSFLPSIGTQTTASGGVGLLASTQFQYQDVGVNLDLTPHLLPTGEVSLHASIDISAVGPSVNFGSGLTEPTFNQRKIEHDIRLKEGEMSLLGGLIQTTESRTVNGVPGLADIPVLHYLFSSERTERVETEVMVMLTPRLIRLPEYAAAREQGVAVGPGTHTPEVNPPPEIPGQPQPPGLPR